MCPVLEAKIFESQCGESFELEFKENTAVGFECEYKLYNSEGFAHDLYLNRYQTCEEAQNSLEFTKSFLSRESVAVLDLNEKPVIGR